VNKKNRQENKSKGPWGMHEYDFTYVKNGDTVERNRFIQAPSEESAIQQFTFLMKKSNAEVKILNIKREE